MNSLSVPEAHHNSGFAHHMSSQRSGLILSDGVYLMSAVIRRFLAELIRFPFHGVVGLVHL